MDLPDRKDILIEEFKDKWQLTPEQLADTNNTEEEIKSMQDFLLSIGDGFREYITDWDLEDYFFLLDEEEDYILGLFLFSKGLTKCWCIISCYGQVEVHSENMDVDLLGDICNLIISGLFNLIGKEY